MTMNPADIFSGPGRLAGLGARAGGAIRDVKARTAPADYGWYPYDSLGLLPLVGELLEPVYGEVVGPLRRLPLADLGCGDGDLGAVFAWGGVVVDAIDHMETNYNQMRGVTLLSESLGLPMKVFDIDLDTGCALPRPDYGLGLFLGTLYHLKNPISALERLSKHCDWCVLGTRVARVTPAGVPMGDEPVAFLLGGRETNNDPTNFWIFSPAGLRRLVQRSGWMVVNEKFAGERERSEPVCAERDERAFLLLKSRHRFPDFQVWPVEGLYSPEEGGWRWTSRRFVLGASRSKDAWPAEFALRIHVPEAVLEAAGAVKMECRIGEELAGSLVCGRAGTIEFRGRFPEAGGEGEALALEFRVESRFQPAGDGRDLGVILPAEEDAAGRGRLPFRIS